MKRIRSLLLATIVIGVGCSENPLNNTDFSGMDNFNYSVASELENWDLVLIDSGQYGPRRANIYRYNLPDIDDKEVLADSVFGFYEISASYDGRYIAYLRDNALEGSNNVQKICIYDLKEGVELETNIGNINYHTLSMKWSPVENKLLITNRAADQENYRMFTLSVATMQTVEILEKSSIINPEWSYDGDHVSFMEYQSFEAGATAIGNIVNISTSAVTTITQDLELFSNLKWSSRENRLFFVEIFSEHFYLSSISLDGSDIKRLVKGFTYEPHNSGSFPRITGPLPAHDGTISVYPNGNYLNVHNFGFIQDDNTYRVTVDVSNQNAERFTTFFNYHSNVFYTYDGMLSFKRGKKQQETFTHLYVALPNGKQLTPIVRTLASGGEVLVPKQTL